MTDLTKRNLPLVPGGTPAMTILTFYREDSDYNGPWEAPIYSIYANDNTTVVFFLTENAAEPVWNELRQRYESKVKAESISVGSDYNLPAGTITNIVSTDILGFTGVENEESCFGGEDPPKKGTIKL